MGTREKASFYVRDGASGDTVQRKYEGAERRWSNRRVRKDRRQEIRFSLDKGDRRQNPGRRAEDKLPFK